MLGGMLLREKILIMCNLMRMMNILIRFCIKIVFLECLIHDFYVGGSVLISKSVFQIFLLKYYTWKRDI